MNLATNATLPQTLLLALNLTISKKSSLRLSNRFEKKIVRKEGKYNESPTTDLQKTSIQMNEDDDDEMTDKLTATFLIS